MKSRSFVLGSFLGLHAIVARASPQGFAPGIIPLRPSSANITRPPPTSTVSACDSECSVLYPQLSAIQWVPEAQVIYTTTITVATLFLNVVRTANSTYTQTRALEFNKELPKDYNSWTIWPNFEGTAVLTFPVTKSLETFYSRIAYPTPYLDYAWEYNWQGVLQTHNKEFVPACATAAPPELSNVPLSREHPDYPQPKGPLSPGKTDPFGNGWVPIWAPYKDEPDAIFFQAAFPSESAFSYCESASHTDPLLTEYTTAKYVTQTLVVSGNFTATPVFTFVSAPGLALPTATGFSDTRVNDPDNVGVQKTVTGFETTPPWGGKGQTLIPSSAAAHLESSVPNLLGPGNPQAHQTDTPEPGSENPPNIGDVIASAIKNNVGIFSSGIQAQQTKPGAPAQFAVAPTPTFTIITTYANGQPTTMPAFILPGGATATIGQSVTINGQATVLSAPPPIFTSVITTINGVATVIPAYIIGGTSTATLGQTVVINGQTTVLTAPTAVLTWVSTTVNGKPTSILVYETPRLSAVPTGTVGASTTAESSNSANAKTTSADSATRSAPAPAAAATTTKSTKGAAPEAWRVSWSAVIVGVGAFALIWL
ncbi:hypothetical protein BCR34DRAFT_587906 [Clohesyomyces aquaticus]|uniref:Uncharacterized protein n=1 Tax=Clohesyomyces aquaticus TaxID=1231657 RepID=A0A1Y1ZME4_9PLEO|nr:hypothetical protein BCR34DRAFT_587906 [Clohesyomyces aquaticus]